MDYQFIIGKSDDDEEDGQHCKSHVLNRFAAECVYCEDGDPVSRDGAGTDEDEVADGRVVEDLVDVGAPGVSYGAQDGRVIQAKTIAAERISTWSFRGVCYGCPSLGPSGTKLTKPRQGKTMSLRFRTTP